MKKYLYTTFLLIILPIIISGEKVIFAFQMHRHGARAPYLGVENNLDFYKEEWIDKEELTNMGKRMLYLLGVKTRKRYMEQTKLLSKEFSPQEILIRSTDVNRTIESVECFIQGLYPHGTGPVLNEKIAKNPNISYPPNKLYKDEFEEVINRYKLNDPSNYYALPYRMNILPVHLFYTPLHEFGLYSTSVCKGHSDIYEKQKIRDEVIQFGRNWTSRFPGIIETLQGTKDEKILYEYWNMFKYADTFVIDDRDQRSLDTFKKLTKNVNDYEDFKNYSRKFLYMDYSETNYPKAHPEITVVALSYTMHSLVNWMEKARVGEGKKSSYIKYVHYSAHDSSIGALEFFMEYAFNTTAAYAELGESRFFEFYQDDSNNYRVRYLKGDSYDPLLDISFDDFKKVINETTWSDEKVAEYCKFNETTPGPTPAPETKLWTTLFIVMIAMGVVVLVLTIILIVLCCKK